jgi:DNA-binding transcriptional MerR regulator
MNNKKPTYSISELSEEFGITPRTLRFYEDQKLISPKREGQTRIYSTADRARLAWILRGKRVGFSIADMAEVLDLYYEEGGKIKQGQITLDACRERIEALEQQKKDIDETIEELKNIIESVEDWMAKQNIKEVGDRKHA